MKFIKSLFFVGIYGRIKMIVTFIKKGDKTMDYGRIMEFKGNWRTYQARVLERAQRYLSDGKIHIVAAPGSGKTTLGIELIKRQSAPALILAPSITIREQWAARITEGFLKEGVEASEYISQSLKEPRVITIVTYQSLHSAMNRYKGKLEETGEMSADSDDANPYDTVEVDFSEFDIIKTMKECKLGVLCLDECHHLRSEWWKALEDFKAGFPNIKVIALTATPPYDSTPALWERYMSMCGEIDEEITIPELVKEGSLCPHQDFVYFNYPTEEEEKSVERFKEESRRMYEFLMTDDGFLQAVASHKAFSDDVDADRLLECPEYFSALLIFARERNIPYSAKLLKLLGSKTLPSMNREWMEKLLRGFLYDDAESFTIGEQYRGQLEAKLKAGGFVEKKKVCLISNPSIEKLLMNSKGKCNSIRDIVGYEYATMGKGLRLLVLTDYIRKEHEKNLGVEQADVASLGVLPFFEQLRRSQQGSGLRLGVLCGTIVIIPAEAKQALLDAVGDTGKVTFSKAGSLDENDYVKVMAVGDNHFLTGAVTTVFSKGYIQALIGTKSLLGEGWDSPCINSLILASFVGSFMLSNQMRGRAIRTYREDPQKASNIWHLVCLPKSSGFGLHADDSMESEDFTLLKRRMEHFLGLHYTEDIIESGIARLSYIEPPFTEENVKRINEKMLELSGKRNALKNRWNAALVNSKKMDVTESTVVEEDALSSYAFKASVSRMAGPVLVTGLSLAGYVAASTAGFALAPVLLPVAAVAGIRSLAELPRLIAVSSSEKRLSGFGKGVKKALLMSRLIEDADCRVAVEKNSKKECYVYLTGGTTKDKKLFSQCMKEAFGPIENQRYLIVEQRGRKKMTSFYCVPECFGKKKEDAQMFYDCVKKFIGKYDLVYTRNEQGRKVLLQGRVMSLGNQKGYKGSLQKVSLK